MSAFSRIATIGCSSTCTRFQPSHSPRACLVWSSKKRRAGFPALDRSPSLRLRHLGTARRLLLLLELVEQPAAGLAAEWRGGGGGGGGRGGRGGGGWGGRAGRGSGGGRCHR